jgi:hypothetical protein
MSITDKYSKETMLEPGKSTWTAEQWADALLRRLYNANWGLPRQVLTDRDPKFVSAVWRAIWKRLTTDLLYTTAHHPSTDGQSERMIQLVESALRHYIQSLEDPSQWPLIIPHLQFEINNSKSSSTGKAPNEIIKGFRPLAVSDVIVGRIPALDDDERVRTRLSAADALATAAMTTKYYYDRKHIAKFFNIGDRVYLRLHKGYLVPQAAVLGRKLGQQFTGPFRITERVGRSAYRLAVPQHWKIHNVVSIDHLEPAQMDPFGRQLPPIQPVRVKDHPIETILAERFKNGKQYLVRYQDLDDTYDQWVKPNELGAHAPQLLEQWLERRMLSR